MRKFVQLCLMLFCLSAIPMQQIFAAALPVAIQENISPTQNATANEIREYAKANKKEFKKHLKEVKKDKKAGTNQVLCAIIAFFIPFLGVGLWTGITKEFWISLLLTILFWLPGVIYAFYVILFRD